MWALDWAFRIPRTQTKKRGRGFSYRGFPCNRYWYAFFCRKLRLRFGSDSLWSAPGPESEQAHPQRCLCPLLSVIARGVRWPTKTFQFRAFFLSRRATCDVPCDILRVFLYFHVVLSTNQHNFHVCTFHVQGDVCCCLCCRRDVFAQFHSVPISLPVYLADHFLCVLLD